MTSARTQTAQAVTSAGKSVGAPCHALSLPEPGEAGERLWAGPWAWRVVCWGMWGLCGFPRCLFCRLSRATVSGALMGGGSRGLGWGR